MARVSLSSGVRVEVIPAPPTTSSREYFTQFNYVSNGHLFVAMRGKLIRTRLSPLGEHHEQSVLGRTGSTDGVGWEAVADIKLVVTGLDVIARSDDEFQLVYVGRNADTDDFATYIHHIDYEGNERLEPYEDAWLCRFVPSNDELVCVAGGLDSSDVPWISLVDVWSMSVLFVLDRPGGIGKYNKFGESWYLAAMENCLVVVGQQRHLVNGFYSPRKDGKRVGNGRVCAGSFGGQRDEMFFVYDMYKDAVLAPPECHCPEGLLPRCEYECFGYEDICSLSISDDWKAYIAIRGRSEAVRGNRVTYCAGYSVMKLRHYVKYTRHEDHGFHMEYMEEEERELYGSDYDSDESDF
ncbi:hypothetical protein FOZ60_002192 [Perkinsus olseni]|uniref:Uncharacterized protein n=1 Tax=Perkinsus olseni TaxID=32597 RepID=A0A7J6NYG0_PEROL|nr:hypothetical protein FOZ60_002192 [Perkinsus olseni]